MAVGDAIKELLIRIGVLGGAEARAEMEAQAAAVEKVGAAGAAAGAASQTSAEAQASALKNLEGALSSAGAVAVNFGASVKAGASQGAIAVPALTDAIGRVEGAIQKVQASGAIVPPASLKSLDDMKALLAGATSAVPPHVEAVGKAGKTHADTKLQVDLARESLGSWGRAIGAATESTNPLISALGRFLLPLAAAASGIVLFNKAATELSARGVDITSLGDKMSGVWDSIAQALGGTSAATAAATASMSAAEGKMQELDGTQRSYGTGLDLIAGLSLDAANATRVFDSSLGQVEVAITGFEQPMTNAGKAIDDLNSHFNTIATLSPQRAAAYRAEFATLVTAAQSGSLESIRALQTFQDGVTKAAAEIDAKLTAIAQAEGKSAAGAKEWAKDAGQIAATAVNAAAGLDTLRKSGETEYEAFNKLKGPIEAVLAFYQRYPNALSALGAEQKALVQRLLDEAKAHTGVVVEEEKHAAKISELRGKYAEIQGAIDTADKKYGDRKVAITSLLSAIDAEIASLEKERQANRGLDPEQQRILDGYKALRAELGLTTEAHSKYGKTIDDGLKKQHDLSKSYEDLTRARQRDSEAIEKHRLDFIAGMDAELKKAVESGTAQVKALTEQHDAMEIDDHEYATSVNQIFADMAAAKRAAVEAEDRATEEAIQKEKEHQKAYEDTAGAMFKAYEEGTGKAITSLQDLKTSQAAWDAETAATLDRVRTGWDRTTEKVEIHGRSYAQLADGFNGFTEVVSSGVAVISAEIDGLTVKITNLKKSLDDVNSAASAAFGDVVSSSSSTAPEPESGPGLYAPGGET